MRHAIELDQGRTLHTLNHLNLVSSHGAISYHGSFKDRTPADEKISYGGEAVARSGTAALGLHLLGQDPNRDLPEIAGYLAEPKTYIHYSRPHTTHVMGRLWCSIALGHVNSTAFRAYMDAEKWYFVLGRRYDGRLTLGPTEGPLGNPMSAEPDSGMFTQAFPCAAVALIYGMGSAKLKMFEGLESKVDEKTLPAFREWNTYLATLTGDEPQLIQEQFPALPSLEVRQVQPYDYQPAQRLQITPEKPAIIEGKIVRVSKAMITVQTGEYRYHVVYSRGSECKLFAGDEALSAPEDDSLTALSDRAKKKALKANPALEKQQKKADKAAKSRIEELLVKDARVRVIVNLRNDEKSGKLNDGTFRITASRIDIL
jgi:hypothetical protein